MEIKELPINEIKPDTGQPRQIFHEDKLLELAANIKNQGQIVPIEIDEYKVIITGERRWRSCKIAGLKTIKCFENRLHGKERFVHQLSENINHNTMSAIDTAKALDKILKDYKVLGSAPMRKNGILSDKGISWLSARLGKSRRWVGNMLTLLHEPREVHEQIAAEEIAPSVIINTNALKDKKLRKILRKKIAEGDIPADKISYRPIMTAMQNNPEKAEEILNRDYRGKHLRDILKTLGKEDAGAAETKALEGEFDDGAEITKLCIAFNKVLSERRLDEVSNTNRGLVLMGLSQLRGKIDRWLQGQTLPRLIEGEVVS